MPCEERTCAWKPCGVKSSRTDAVGSSMPRPTKVSMLGNFAASSGAIIGDPQIENCSKPPAGDGRVRVLPSASENSRGVAVRRWASRFWSRLKLLLAASESVLAPSAAAICIASIGCHRPLESIAFSVSPRSTCSKPVGEAESTILGSRRSSSGDVCG